MLWEWQMVTFYLKNSTGQSDGVIDGVEVSALFTLAVHTCWNNHKEEKCNKQYIWASQCV